MSKILFGIIVVLILTYLLILLDFNFCEIKSIWWIFVSIFTLSICAHFLVIYNDNITANNLVHMLVGLIFGDCIISIIFLLYEYKLYDLLFIITHHFIWALSLYYLVGSSCIIYALLGQIAISSLDVFINTLNLIENVYHINKKSKKLFNLGNTLNFYGRLIIGNLSIQTCLNNSNLLLPVLGFNTVVGSVLLFSNDYWEYY